MLLNWLDYLELTKRINVNQTEMKPICFYGESVDLFLDDIFDGGAYTYNAYTFKDIEYEDVIITLSAKVYGNIMYVEYIETCNKDLCRKGLATEFLKEVCKVNNVDIIIGEALYEAIPFWNSLGAELPYPLKNSEGNLFPFDVSIEY